MGKELILKRMQKGLTVITLQGAIKVQYCYRNIGKINDWMATYLFRILVVAIIFSPAVVSLSNTRYSH